MYATIATNDVPRFHFCAVEPVVRSASRIDTRVTSDQYLKPTEWRSVALKMAASGVNAAYICAALCVNRFELEHLVRTSGIELNRAALSKRETNHSWSYGDLARLTRQWLAGTPVKTIAATLQRTIRSVKSKRAALALPPRFASTWQEEETQQLVQAWGDGTSLREIATALKRTVRSVSGKKRRLGLTAKPGAIPTDPSVVLTWDQASRLTPEERCGRSWMVKDSPSRLVVGFKKTLGARKTPMVTAWSQEMENELAYRHFANQSPQAIAEAFLFSERTIVSRSSWLHLPRRRKKALRADYDPALAPVRIAELDYIQRECLGKKGFFFWTSRRNGRRISRRHQQSQVMRSAV